MTPNLNIGPYKILLFIVMESSIFIPLIFESPSLCIFVLKEWALRVRLLLNDKYTSNRGNNNAFWCTRGDSHAASRSGQSQWPTSPPHSNTNNVGHSQRFAFFIKIITILIKAKNLCMMMMCESQMFKKENLVNENNYYTDGMWVEHIRFVKLIEDIFIIRYGDQVYFKF